jgi:hypothetical protein
MQAHRMATNDRIDILETQYFKLAYLIPFKTEDLPRTGLKKAKAVTPYRRTFKSIKRG